MTLTTVHVGLDTRAYNVVIGSELIAQAGTKIAPFCPSRRVAVVADAAVAA